MKTTLDQFNAYARGNKVQVSTGNRCVIYTRVSTKDQADNNMSLITQKKLCEQFCEKQSLEIVGYFGGTYESAKTDERKEFNAMLAFIKRCKEPISQIVVYSIDRFSRSGANAIYIKEQLSKQGVAIQSVSQPADINTSSGRLQQNIQLIFSDFDNELRRDKCVTGMREALLRGEWIGTLPTGYDNTKVNGKRKITVNEVGKKVKQIFEWKANEGISCDQIRARLQNQGLKLPHQRISEILKNPFYCGILINKILEGQIVEGKHEKLISQELFLKANAAKQGNSGGYKVMHENNDIPLKHFLKCDNCGKYLRGYKAQKNQKYYYKCGTLGCACNKRAEQLHQQFLQKLNEHTVNISEQKIPVIKKVMMELFEKNNSNAKDATATFKSQLVETKKKIERLEDRFVNEEINKEIFDKFHAKLKSEQREIETNLNKPQNNASNPEKAVEIAVHLASKLNTLWASSDYPQKLNLQNLVFPEGISYNRKNDECRTLRTNSIFLSIADIARLLEDFKTENPDDWSGFSAWVEVVRTISNSEMLVLVEKLARILLLK
jgi:site-specific DNA recombinase